jgi:hypothetical protein
MNTLIEKFARVASAVEADKGPFVLFGLFQRADTADLWDLVCSATWLDESRLEGMRHLAKRLGEFVDPEEMLILSRIVPIGTGDASVIQVSDLTRNLNKPVKMGNFVFAGTMINAAYILAANSPGIVVPHLGGSTRL